MPFQYLYRGDDFRDLSQETRDLLDQRDLSLENYLNQEVGRFTSYTPTWTGALTNPTIGNGTITGSYTQFGKLVIAEARINANQGSTFGSGTYFMTVPVAMNPATTSIERRQIGTAFLYDGTVGRGYVMAVQQYDATTAWFVPDNTSNARWSPTSPFTFDQYSEFRMLLTYEAA